MEQFETRNRAPIFPRPDFELSQMPAFSVAELADNWLAILWIDTEKATSANEDARSTCLGGVCRPGVRKERRLPTLAQAIQALPSALQRFTAVFGMGTGVSVRAWSPAVR